MSTTTKLPDWKRNITYLSVIYAMLEQGKKIPLLLEGDDVFLNPILDEMNNKGFITPKSTPSGDRVWAVTDQGDELRGKMVAMYDQLLKFEIFAYVNQALALTPEQSQNGDCVMVYDDVLDPRFVPCAQSVDLRLAMLSWYSEAAEQELHGKIDLHQIVFMQKLRAGYYNEKGRIGNDFWFSLRVGDTFAGIETVIENAVKWREMGSDEDEAGLAMNAIYSAGMAEQIKRDGEKCQCGAYLGMYAYYAAVDGKTLTECPCCQGSFVVPPPVSLNDTERCPNCDADIAPKHRKCRGCGAKIDRSMGAGTISETTTETTYETYDVYNPWGASYVSYGYYAPEPVYMGVYYDTYSPVASIMAFGLLCAIL